MAKMTPEQFLQGLHQRGISIDLVDVEPEPRFCLSVPESARITERIREYIRRHRQAIAALFGLPYCHQCWRPVDEMDESSWRVSEAGDLYCLACWQSITAPASDPPVPAPAPAPDGGAAFLARVAGLVDAAGAWPDGYSLRLVDRAFCERIHALPDEPPAPAAW